MVADEDVLTKSRQFFEIQQENLISVDFFRTNVIAKFFHGVLCLHRLCRKHSLCGTDTEDQHEITTKFKNVMGGLKLASDFMLTHIRQKNFLQGDVAAVDLNSVLDTDNKLSNWQLVAEFLLKRIFELGYKRYQASAYKVIRVVYARSVDGEQFFTEYEEFLQRSDWSVPVSVLRTHAYNLECYLEKLLYRLISRTTEYDVWLNFTNCGGVTSLVKYLENCCDPEFPDLVPNRTARSFHNGILLLDDIHNPEWFGYQEEDNIPPNLVCCKYFSAEFDTNLFAKHWMHIPTPYFDQILTDQKMAAPQKEIFYAMLGRCGHELSKHDMFQVLFFIKGVAQSGKSCIGHALKGWYRTEDVGILSSNIEEKFGLEAIYKKLLFICFEVTKKFGLSRAEFQSIISGEEVSISRKNKVAEPVRWSVPGIMFGNELGPWLDSAGSMIRRLLIAEFNHRITEVNLELESLIRSELPVLIHKCNQAYRELLTRSKNRSIWDVVPSFFREVRKRVSENMNPVRAFLFESGKVYVGPGGQIQAHQFDSALRAWCIETGYRTTTRFTKEDYTDVFGEYGIVEEDNKEDVDEEGRVYRGKWYVGVRKMTEELREVQFNERERLADQYREAAQAETDRFESRIPKEAKNSIIRNIFALIQSHGSGSEDYYQYMDFHLVSGVQEQAAGEEGDERGEAV